ncbi:dihydrofolate reductase [Ahrensia sp. R2A130]|uniref:dihydrofolate reductase n=1 Tax=Ahrensia sp. R2A130 TaxID=744979 RepID=UPI0001E0BC57|nr:dihydrofolate reductase [Ahrensia sp. R2A130]EFL90777.1 dihydrofolate reductase [Ahrensia sp. R2A130]
MNPRVSIVVAAAENGIIGADGDMPWRLSSDLKRFKALTIGKPMIMGRKTFASIGKALPGRTSIVVTRDRNYQAEGAVVVSDLDQAFDLAREVAFASQADEIAIIGGGQIYAQTLERADIVHLTTVHADPEGDTSFPTLDPQEWSVDHEETVPAGPSDSEPTTYRIYERKGSAS